MKTKPIFFKIIDLDLALHGALYLEIEPPSRTNNALLIWSEDGFYLEATRSFFSTLQNKKHYSTNLLECLPDTYPNSIYTGIFNMLL